MNGKCIMCGESLPEGEFHKIYDCYEYTKKINAQLLEALEYTRTEYEDYIKLPLSTNAMVMIEAAIRTAKGDKL